MTNLSQYNFYQEPDGNCIAVYGNWFRSGGYSKKECIASVYEHKNSQCAVTSISEEILSTYPQVAEEQARIVHPALFEYIENIEE